MMMAQGGVSLPAGYTKIEYLESDGNSYIDTGFKPNQDTRVLMEASLLSLDGDQYFYGAKDSGSTQSFVGAYSDGAVTFGYANSFPSAALDLQIEEKIVIDQNCEKGFVNGELVATANTTTFQTPCSLYLCARNNDGEISKVTKARLYSCQIYDNGTLVRDFIPAMNASGKAGLYDLKNDVWYALLPVAKPKVENKISIYIDRSGFNGTIIRQSFGFQSTFPVTSTIRIMCRIVEYDSDESFWLNGLYTMDSGITKTSTKETYNFVTKKGTMIDSITSISPTEDDTYIYTF